MSTPTLFWFPASALKLADLFSRSSSDRASEALLSALFDELEGLSASDAAAFGDAADWADRIDAETDHAGFGDAADAELASGQPVDRPYHRIARYLSGDEGREDGLVMHFAQVPVSGGSYEEIHSIRNSVSVDQTFNDITMGVPAYSETDDLEDGAIDALSALDIDTGEVLSVAGPELPEGGFESILDGAVELGLEFVVKLTTSGIAFGKYPSVSTDGGWTVKIMPTTGGYTVRLERLYYIDDPPYSYADDAVWESSVLALDADAWYHVVVSHDQPTSWFDDAPAYAWVTEIGSADIASATELANTKEPEEYWSQLATDQHSAFEAEGGTYDELRLGFAAITASQARTLYHAFNDTLCSYGSIQEYGVAPSEFIEATGRVSIPLCSVAGTVVKNPVGTAEIFIPMITVDAYCGAFGDVVAPIARISGSASVSIVSAGMIIIPSASIASAARVAISAAGEIAIPMPRVHADGNRTQAASGRIGIPMAAVALAANIGEVLAIGLIAIPICAASGHGSNQSLTAVLEFEHTTEETC